MQEVKTMQNIIINTRSERDVEIEEMGVTVFKGSVADNSTEQAWIDFIRGVYQAGITTGIAVSAAKAKEAEAEDRVDTQREKQSCQRA